MSKCFATLAFFLAFSFTAQAQAPADFDRFVGAYQVTPAMFLWLRRDGGRLFVRNTNQEEHEALPQSPTILVFPDAPLRLTFSDAEVLLSNGTNERHAPRVSVEFARDSENALAQRIRNNQPSPGTEASLRRYIESLEKGAPNYEEMGPTQAEKVRAQLPTILAGIKRLGAFKTLTFKSVSNEGMDVYEAEFEHGTVRGLMAPLSADVGKVQLRGFGPF